MNTPFGRGLWSRATAVALLALCLLLAACGDDDAAVDADTAADADLAETAEPTDTNDSAGAAGPVVIDNCDFEVTVDGPPQRAVTMNQAATEIMLALGLEDHMVGTAYLDDEILPELADAYDAVPVLSDEYPSTEALYDVEPDFVYGSYATAFGDTAAGARDELADVGIASYLSIGGCPSFRESGEPLAFDDVFGEIRDIATIFGVTERGEELIAEQQAMLDEAEITDQDITVMWWDGQADAPTVGACCGAPGMLMTALGLTNAYNDESGSWATINWEQVISDDPDIIILVEASWDPAADKEAHLRADPALSDLSAVANDRLVEIPFSATTPGVRNAPALAQLSEDIRSLDLGS